MAKRLDSRTPHKGTLVANLAPEHLPDWRALLSEGRVSGERLTRSPTQSNLSNGVDSQAQWSDRCAADGQFRTQMNIGLATWQQTQASLQRVSATMAKAGLRAPDAYQLILERRMGLPSEMRANAPQETGPVLWTEADWQALGTTTPIQPQAPLIGTPASFENVAKGLAAGLDSIGNFSNFVLRYPYFDDDVLQCTSVLKALGTVLPHAADGVVIDSYLEDGHCGAFGDYRSIVGWSLVERHIVETLCGVPFAIAFGGLTSDPFKRASVYRAMERCTSTKTLRHGYLHGGTVAQTESSEQNLASFFHDVSVSLAAIHHFGWGCAYLVVPLTERERVPSTDEMIEVHQLTRHAESHARVLARQIDWSGVEAAADALAASGQRWYQKVMDFFTASGYDIANPLQLMLVARRIKPDVLERVGLAGERGAEQPTELLEITRTETKAISAVVQAAGVRCEKARVLVASTDVHWPAKSVIEDVLRGCGAIVVNGGLAADPEHLVAQAVIDDCAAVVITTHNGWALNFGVRFIAECERREVSGLKVIMGGVLNEDGGPGANSELPRDVSADLNALGITTTDDFVRLVEVLAEA